MEEGYGTTDVAAQFYRLNDSVYYKEMLNDTLWQVVGEELRTAYIINRGKYGFSLKDKEQPATVWQKKFAGCISVNYIFECNRFIYLTFNFMTHYPFSFYRKSNSSPDKTPYEIIGMYDKNAREFFLVKPVKQKEQIQPTGIENDMDGGIHFMPKYSFDSLLVCWVTATDLKKFAASEAFKNSLAKFPEKKKELERLANSLNENDNPVVMLVKLKY